MAKVAHWRFDIAPVNGVVADDMAGVSGLVATWDGPPPGITQEGGISGVRVNGAVSVVLTGSIPINPNRGITIAFRGILEANQGWGTIFGINNGSTTPIGDSAILLSQPAEASVVANGRIFSAWKVNSNDFGLGGNVPLGTLIKGYVALKLGARELFSSGGYTPVVAVNAATPGASTYTKGKMLGKLYSNDSPIKGFFSEVMLFDHYASFEEVFSEVSFKTQPITAIPANQEPRSQFEPQDVVWRGSPGGVYAGPMPAAAVTADPLCLGQDLNWVRDGNQNVAQGYIESTVTIDGEGVRRRVLCLDQAGNLIGETYSRASDGKYRFDLLWLNRRYMLVAQDDPAFGPADYNAVAADYQLPTPYAPGEGVGLSGG